jgi:hypothetical protein
MNSGDFLNFARGLPADSRAGVSMPASGTSRQFPAAEIPTLLEAKRTSGEAVAALVRRD